MNIKISNHLFLTDTPFRFAELIRKRLTLQNPAFDDAVRMNRWRGNLDEYLRCYRQNENGLIIPRGFCGQLIGMAKQSGVTYQIEDRRRTLPQVDFNFAGTLKPFQQKAVELMLKKDFGTLSSPTGSGKTIMALSIIEQRQQPALIIVHTKELLNQWVDMIGTFLSGKGLARFLSISSARFQPLPIGTAREVFPQAARPAIFTGRVMGPRDASGHFHLYASTF
jgi:SNF2 family DNA or RNA helicase